MIAVLLIQGSVICHALDLSGRIQIEPPFEPAKAIKVRKKTQDSCSEDQISKSLLVSEDGGVANTVLWLKGSFEVSAQIRNPVTLDQSGCNFEPHVVLIPPGGRMQVLNSDPLAHDVRAFEQASMLFRLDMDTHAKPEFRSFEKPGVYTIRCGLHPWMHAFAVQAEHDFYAVTDSGGRFTLKNIPEGQHLVHIWHETLGEVEIPLEANAETQDFSYTFKSILPPAA